MNNLKNVSKKLFILVILISSIFPYSLYARTSREIADEIRKQQEALKNTQESLKQAQQNIGVYSDLLENTKGGLPQLEGEIKILEAEIEANEFELDLNKKQKDLRELEKEQRMIEQNSSIKGVYMNWRVESGANLKDALHAFDFKKYEVYSSVLTNYQTGNLEGITNKINRLESDIEKYNKKLATLEEKNTELSKKKKDLEEQIRNYQNALAYNSYQIGNLNNSANQLRGTISSLSAEQAAAIQRESYLQNQNPTNAGSGSSGNLSFRMFGRDARQGHGVGMSQYGAHGMAQKGKSYVDILTFYYRGTRVVDYPEMSTITISYCKSNPNYLNTPAFAEENEARCSNEDIITKTIAFNDYLGGLEEMPESWPIEARKAQMVAARTYAIGYTGNGAKAICLTQTCQVSKPRTNGTEGNWMDDGDLEVAVATKGKVLTYNGSLVKEAVYSSDNSQGWGTADNDTIWQNFQGYGTPEPYLRAVNDTSFATPTYYTNKECRSNNYSLADIYDVIHFNRDTFYDSGKRQDIANLLNKLGGRVTSLSFERDPSQRVKRVIFNGNSSISIGGYWFKALWNEWVFYKQKVNTSSCQDLAVEVKIDGKEKPILARFDYLYSQTFFLDIK